VWSARNAIAIAPQAVRVYAPFSAVTCAKCAWPGANRPPGDSLTVAIHVAVVGRVPSPGSGIRWLQLLRLSVDRATVDEGPRTYSNGLLG